MKTFKSILGFVLIIGAIFSFVIIMGSCSVNTSACATRVPEAKNKMKHNANAKQQGKKIASYSARAWKRVKQHR